MKPAAWAPLTAHDKLAMVVDNSSPTLYTDFMIHETDIDAFTSALKSALKKLPYYTDESITVKRLKSPSECSLSFFGVLAARLKTVGERITVTAKAELFSDALGTEKPVSGVMWRAITLPLPEAAALLSDNARAAYDACYLSKAVPEFGCCSGFTACSDAGRCVLDDILFASGCLYKKQLEQGRIYYGRNRNV